MQTTSKIEVGATGADGDADVSARPVPIAGERLVLSVPEAAQLLGISRAHAYELARRGALPAIRLGRRVVVPRHAVIDQLEQRSASEEAS